MSGVALRFDDQPLSCPVQVGDKDHLKVIANEIAAEAWFSENDPEGLHSNIRFQIANSQMFPKIVHAGAPPGGPRLSAYWLPF